MDDRRHLSRLKSINLTKLQESYKNYTKVVPKETRVTQLSDSWHVNTPDHRLNISNSLWNKKLSNWRKKIHKWNYIKESDFEVLSDKLKQGNIEEFVSICEGSKANFVDVDVCDDLLNNHNSQLFYPVIYKPYWFNGEISENNFQTLSEAEFINKSIRSLSSLDKDFTSKFMSLYTSNYKPDSRHTMFLSRLLSGLQRMSILKCGDNSGVIKGCIIGLGRNKHGTGKIGDRIKVSVRDKTPECNVQNKTPRGIIIRRKKQTSRKDGMVFKFDENSFVIISNNKLQGTKIKGPVLLETRHSCKSLASKIL